MQSEAVAVQSEDVVVQAVRTTGIYCRPSCKARPKPENVMPFASAVAAEAAGFRSCMRCRPYRMEQSIAALGAPAEVVGAVALITEGFLDHHGVPELARRVGYSTRQLDRLFTEYVGATPSFVARSRRAHFARRLLDETDLSVSVIARASGFGSVRQMNRVVDEIFHLPPGELRARRRRSDVLTADGGLALRLPINGPFSQAMALDHVASRLTAGVESAEGSAYRRTTVTCGHPGVIEVFFRDSESPGEVRSGSGQDHLELHAHLPTFDSIIDDVARIRWMFGLHEDTTAAESHLMSDPLIGPTVRSQRGLRVIGGWDRFETAVRIVIGQQVSVVAATGIATRIAMQWGTPTPAPVLGLDRIFPTPDRLAELPPSGVGMPESRVETIRALSRAILAGDLDLHGTADPATVRTQLLAIHGIGPWSADMIEMRVLRNPDTFPAGDLGIRKAASALAGSHELLATEAVRDMAEAWRPHRSLAAQHLWRSLQSPVIDPRGAGVRD